VFSLNVCVKVGWDVAPSVCNGAHAPVKLLTVVGGGGVGVVNVLFKCTLRNNAVELLIH
jgi:hypothetical protein